MNIPSEASAEYAEFMLAVASRGLAYGLSLVGISAVIALRARQKGVIGAELQRSLADRKPRLFQAALGLALILALALSIEARESLPSMLPLIVLAGAFHLIRPDSRDQICGDKGLRLGWTVLLFKEFESWRLMGEHLRFQKFGLWEAVALDPEHHDKIRAILEREAGERESNFNQ